MQPLPHPLRFRAEWPVAQEFEHRLQELSEHGALVPKAAHEQAMQALTRAHAVRGVSVKSMDLRAFGVQAMQTLAWGQWRMHGSKVYMLTPALRDAFAHSDVSEVRVDDLDFPHTSLYIGFDPQDDLCLDLGWPVDGAYVLYAPGVSMRIVLTSRAPQGVPWFDRVGDTYDLRISAQHFGLDMEAAIDAALADDLNDLRQAHAKMVAQGSTVPGALQANQTMIDIHLRTRDTLRRVMSLVANTLCYLSAYPEDQQTQWLEGAPARLVEQSQSGPPTQVRRARSKLWALGHTRVTRIGMAFEPEATQGASKHPHWRRGHWRMQAHGPAHSLRKLLWIHPVRVTRAGMEEPDIIRVDVPRPTTSP